MNDAGSRFDRFYKVSVTDRKGNVFTRLEALEELVKSIKFRDTATIINNIITQNWEFIRSSIAGGTNDPTDPTFTGVVISASGQMINGVLYNFALIENGVVVSGIGQDITNNITNVLDPTGMQRSWFFS